MPIVIDPNKQVADPVLLSALERQGIDWRYVEFYQDYAPAYVNDIKIKGQSPFAKFYRHTEMNKRWMVVAQLPMVNADGIKVEVGWVTTDAKNFNSKINQFIATVSETKTSITALNDQPDGKIKKDNVLSYQPQLYLDDKEVKPSNWTPYLYPIDPTNENYQSNVLEWDYGICKRRLRLIEGKLLGTWVFAENPNGEVRIQYNQTGDFKLHLGQYAISDSEELIPTKEFENPIFGYPFTISDSLTFYPDAHVESTSVDGIVYRGAVNELWANIKANAGTTAVDTADNINTYAQSTATTNQWSYATRCPTLFDTSGLPDAAIITAAVVSYYGKEKFDNFPNTPTHNIYSVATAGNTSLTAADYNVANWGATAWCDTAITYDNWNIGTPGTANDFTFNATGLAAISLNGVTKFGIRNAKHDAGSTTPSSHPGTGDVAFYVAGWTAEKGNSYKPKLVVTYTTFQPWAILI